MFPKFENENGKFVGSSETAESISAKLPQKYWLYSLILLCCLGTEDPTKNKLFIID